MCSGVFQFVTELLTEGEVASFQLAGFHGAVLVTGAADARAYRDRLV